MKIDEALRIAEVALPLNDHSRALKELGNRYAWLRRHGAWETEAFLNGLETPEEYDTALAKRMAEDP